MKCYKVIGISYGIDNQTYNTRDKLKNPKKFKKPNH